MFMEMAGEFSNDIGTIFIPLQGGSVLTPKILTPTPVTGATSSCACGGVRSPHVMVPTSQRPCTPKRDGGGCDLSDLFLNTNVRRNVFRNHN